jgi:hypothetical protein
VFSGDVVVCGVVVACGVAADVVVPTGGSKLAPDVGSSAVIFLLGIDEKEYAGHGWEARPSATPEFDENLARSVPATQLVQMEQVGACDDLSSYSPAHQTQQGVTGVGATRHEVFVRLTLRLKLCGQGLRAEADAARRLPHVT